MQLTRERFGTVDGADIDLFTLRNDNGLEAQLTNFGAILTALKAPDRKGRIADITLGHDDLAGWQANDCYMGATVGRYGNRIANGRFELDGTTCQLATNDSDHHLHGGDVGFNKRVWTAAPFDEGDRVGVGMQYTSPDGEEGYPGTLTAQVTYALTRDNELQVRFTAETDRPTIVNLVHHTYWNLSGDPTQTIGDHVLALHADKFLPVDDGAIPTGTVADVAGTPMDFRSPTPVGERIDQVDGGYDHNWILRTPEGELTPAAEVTHPGSGRTLSITTDQAGIQFYAGNFLDGTLTGKGGVRYARRTGFCLETQRWPDSPNQPAFPSAVLRPGQTYTHRMDHRFGIA